WGQGKDVISADKQYATLDEQVGRFIGYLESLVGLGSTPHGRGVLRRLLVEVRLVNINLRTCLALMSPHPPVDPPETLTPSARPRRVTRLAARFRFAARLWLFCFCIFFRRWASVVAGRRALCLGFST